MRDDTEDAVWYFAFGSMCNPISMKRRGLMPFESKPALIQGYQLAFQLGGMANLVPDPTAFCHGILHHITAEMFKTLCKIEATYDIVSVLATPYEPYIRVSISKDSSSNSKPECNGDNAASSTDPTALVPGNPGSAITAAAFIVQPEHFKQLTQQHPEWSAQLPSERYINIITGGLRHYGAAPEWIQKVAAEPHIPGKTPDQYLKFPEPEDAGVLPEISVQQLAEHQGKIIDNKVIMACGHKVVEIDTSSQPNAPYIRYLRDHMSGRCNVFGTCMNLYDPKLPPLQSPAELTQEHVDWCENFTMEWLQQHKYGIRQVGWLAAPIGAAAGAVHGL